MSSPRISRIVVDFPAPLGPEKAGDNAGLDGEAEVVHSDLFPVALGQIVYLDHTVERTSW